MEKGPLNVFNAADDAKSKPKKAAKSERILFSRQSVNRVTNPNRFDLI